ncbi:MAG: TetR/AcrR family transcriptional regulator C-terminal domain-containing protein [Acidimicrobiales bacterium]
MKSARPPLSLDRIITAAVALADREGLDQLSMRRLGAELGVEAMSLYHYVGSKDELLDRMLDQVIAEIALPPEGESWWQQLWLLAHEFRNCGRRHPGVLPLFGARAIRSVEAFAPLERAYAVLRRNGLEPAAALDSVVTLASFVFGFALIEPGGIRDVLEGRTVDFAHLDTEHPDLLEMGSVFVERDPDEQFSQGLRVVLRGIGAALGEQTTSIEPR